MTKKKHALSFEEFLLEKKKEQDKPDYKIIDWDVKRDQWLNSINDLYLLVDDLIVEKLKKVGYNVAAVREETRISEDFIGTYIAHNYIIITDKFKIRFCPISGIMVLYNGRVNMILPGGSVKLILSKELTWTIADKFSVPMNLVEFNEKNIQKVFEDYL